MELSEQLLTDLSETHFCVAVNQQFRNQALLLIEGALLESFKAGVYQATKEQQERSGLDL